MQSMIEQVSGCAECHNALHSMSLLPLEKPLVSSMILGMGSSLSVGCTVLAKVVKLRPGGRPCLCCHLRSTRSAGSLLSQHPSAGSLLSQHPFSRDLMPSHLLHLPGWQLMHQHCPPAIAHRFVCAHQQGPNGEDAAPTAVVAHSALAQVAGLEPLQAEAGGGMLACMHKQWPPCARWGGGVLASYSQWGAGSAGLCLHAHTQGGHHTRQSSAALVSPGTLNMVGRPAPSDRMDRNVVAHAI